MKVVDQIPKKIYSWYRHLEAHRILERNSVALWSSVCQTILISFHDRMTKHVAWRQAIEAIYLSFTQAFSSVVHGMPSSQLRKCKLNILFFKLQVLESSRRIWNTNIQSWIEGNIFFKVLYQLRRKILTSVLQWNKKKNHYNRKICIQNDFSFLHFFQMVLGPQMYLGGCINGPQQEPDGTIKLGNREFTELFTKGWAGFREQQRWCSRNSCYQHWSEAAGGEQ